MGQQGIGQMNENGELLADFCIINRLVIGGTLFPPKQLNKSPWVSPDGRKTNQIDHIAISCRWRSSLLDVRAKRGVDVASDHHLVIGEVKIKLSTRRQPRPTRWRYDVDKLKDGYNKQCFELALSNRYASLEEEEDEEHHGHHYLKSTKAIIAYLFLPDIKIHLASGGAAKNDFVLSRKVWHLTGRKK